MKADTPADKPAPPSERNASAKRIRAERRLFWKGLYPHAIPFVPLLAVLRPGYFKPDRELIHGLAEATTPAQFRDELTSYMTDPRNATWLRFRVRLRVSVRRVERYARLCLGPQTPEPEVRTSRRLAGEVAARQRRNGE
jgi:hypothetical protein